MTVEGCVFTQTEGTNMKYASATTATMASPMATFFRFIPMQNWLGGIYAYSLVRTA